MHNIETVYELFLKIVIFDCQQKRGCRLTNASLKTSSLIKKTNGSQLDFMSINHKQEKSVDHLYLIFIVKIVLKGVGGIHALSVFAFKIAPIFQVGKFRINRLLICCAFNFIWLKICTYIHAWISTCPLSRRIRVILTPYKK